MSRNASPVMTVTINGKQQSVSEGATLLGYLKDRGVDPLHVVAEVGGVIIDNEQYGTYTLKQGDVVEIIQFVVGG